MAAALLAAPSVSADPPGPPTYRESVQEAYDLVSRAASNDPVPAERAVFALETGTGDTQPEIIADLTQRPPDYTDAQDRLGALLAALDHQVDTPDPVLARQRLNDVLSMHRYDALHRPPSALDRLVQWVVDRITQLLDALSGRATGTIFPVWVFYLAAAVVIAAVAVVVFGSARGRLTERISASRPAGPRPPADYFAEADRLAARGDRVGAVRALCAGVAGALGGEGTWDGSPLTVREIFQRAEDASGLRPLLIPFEAAIYGARDVDAATYEKAARAAEPYRSGPPAAEAAAA